MVKVREISGSHEDLRDVVMIGMELRASDRQELLGASGVHGAALPLKLLEEAQEALKCGGHVWVAELDGEPVCLFGARPVSHLARAAEIFMLATSAADAQPLALARWSRRGLEMIMAAQPEISAWYNWIPRDSQKLRAWLEWLGAHIEASGWLSPWTGAVYARFCFERERERGG